MKRNLCVKKMLQNKLLMVLRKKCWKNYRFGFWLFGLQSFSTYFCRLDFDLLVDAVIDNGHLEEVDRPWRRGAQRWRRCSGKRRWKRTKSSSRRPSPWPRYKHVLKRIMIVIMHCIIMFDINGVPLSVLPLPRPRYLS